MWHDPASSRPDASAWPDLHLVGPLKGGARNSVWFAKGTNGSAWVLKSTTHSEAALRWLLPVHDAARLAGFAVPMLSESPCGLLAPAGWTCEPMIEGALASPGDLPMLARQLAVFHLLAADLPPRPGLTGYAANPARPADLPPKLARLIDTALAPVAGAAVGTIHADINPGNVILSEAGPALIDWDEARRDWLFLDQITTRQSGPTEATAALACEILNCWGPEPERARELAARLGAISAD